MSLSGCIVRKPIITNNVYGSTVTVEQPRSLSVYPGKNLNIAQN